MVTDQKAAVLIRDIAIARNASDWKGNEGYASAFELLNSPLTLMGEIVHNIFDREAVRTITELDIKGAIESGALRLDLASQ